MLLNAVLDRDPYSPAALELIPAIRAAAKRAGGTGTLVGGATAIERDLRVASARDTRLIVPITLAVVFLILVALGVDYNIFLMARVREETLAHGTRAGMLRGLAVTGGVITSAGIVLAGTFTTLTVLPFVFLTEVGFVVAFGVLLDTFLVRSVLVPALVLDLDRRTWSPSALGRRMPDEHARKSPARPHA